jgi:DNA polymerase II small subunit/DNA polymerase delta subunit B
MEELSRSDAEAAAMDGRQQKEMFVQQVATSDPLVRSPTNGRASRASLPQPANSEPVTIRQHGRAP